MILGRNILTDLVLDLKFSEKFVWGGERSYEGCTMPMADIITLKYKLLNIMTDITSEKEFTDVYVEENFKL